VVRQVTRLIRQKANNTVASSRVASTTLVAGDRVRLSKLTTPGGRDDKQQGVNKMARNWSDEVYYVRRIHATEVPRVHVYTLSRTADGAVDQLRYKRDELQKVIYVPGPAPPPAVRAPAAPRPAPAPPVAHPPP
jgi:hypothetical protein